MASRISQVFSTLGSQGGLAFMPFITAGDPDLEMTKSLIRELARSGVDLIEIGFPYSDPIADGPVIQASYTRALRDKVSVSGIFQALSELKGEPLPPLLAMVSYAIVFRTGLDAFLDRCVTAGISGLIIPDLPGAEARDVFQATAAKGLDLVQLVAPTTPRQRVKQILGACSGFVYCIAVAGTTGAREQVAETLLDQLKWLREETSLPLAVGFGISRPEHVEPLRKLAHGVIVGSAIVKTLQDVADGKFSAAEATATVGEFAAQMADAAHRRPS